MGKYQDIYQQSLQDPDTFWGDTANELSWDKPWDDVLDANSDAEPVPRWFTVVNSIPATTVSIDMSMQAEAIKQQSFMILP